MKKSSLPILFIALWFMLAAMGGMPSEETPKPEIDFHATVIDNQNISTECEEVTWEGEIFFVATRGKGIVTIPFEKVKRVLFIGSVSSGRKNARITLRNGAVVAVSFDAKARLYGLTDFGSYRITVENLKEIIFK